jgi:hypothetical protein
MMFYSRGPRQFPYKSPVGVPISTPADGGHQETASRTNDCASADGYDATSPTIVARASTSCRGDENRDLQRARHTLSLWASFVAGPRDPARSPNVHGCFDSSPFTSAHRCQRFCEDTLTRQPLRSWTPSGAAREFGEYRDRSSGR